MTQEIVEEHRSDNNGNPAGGTTSGTGFKIDWQNGPLMVDGQRVEPNGAFVEGIIAAAIGRIKFYQQSRFNCRENSLALTKLEESLHWLQARTATRTKQGVEGTHAVHA